MGRNQFKQGVQLTRRRILGAGGAAGMLSFLDWEGLTAAAVAQTPPSANLNGTSLRILQWQHVIHEYDVWFGQFASTWGQQHGVAVNVDFVDTATIPNALQTEIAMGAGHDLIEHIAPLPMFAQSMVDLNDLVKEATTRHGAQQDFCRQDGMDTTSGRAYGFTHGYAPSAVNVRPKLWEPVQIPDGPTTWDELSSGSAGIWRQQGIELGLGMADDLDSNTSALIALWAHGASIQDENGTIAINRPEAVEVVTRFKQLYDTCLTPGVFRWNILSNNTLMINGQASVIFNALSAFRAAEAQKPEIAADFLLRAPLNGPAGTDHALAPAHARFISMIPAFSPNQATAKEFLLALVANYNLATTASKSYNFPAFASTVPGLKQDGGPLDFDPAFPDQGTALSALKQSNSWTVQLGWPGPTTPLVASAIGESVLSQMMARAAKGELSPKNAVAEAETRLKAIAARG